MAPFAKGLAARRSGQSSAALKSAPPARGVFVVWNGTTYNLEHASSANILKLIREASGACLNLYVNHGTAEGIRSYMTSNPERYEELKTLIQHLPLILLRHDRDLRTNAPSKAMGLDKDEAKVLHKLVFDLHLGTLLMIATDEEDTSTLWAANQVAQNLLMRIDEAYQSDAYLGKAYWSMSHLASPTSSGTDGTRAAAAIALAERAAQPLLIPGSAQFSSITNTSKVHLPNKLILALECSIDWLNLAYSVASTPVRRAEISLLAATLCHQAAVRAVDGITLSALRNEPIGEYSRTTLAYSAEDIGIHWAQRGLDAVEEIQRSQHSNEVTPTLVQGLKLVYASLVVANLNRRLALLSSGYGYDEMQRWVSVNDVAMAREAFLMATDIRWQSAAVFLDVAGKYNNAPSSCLLDENAPAENRVEVDGVPPAQFDTWFVSQAIEAGRHSEWERDQICRYVVNRGRLYMSTPEWCSYEGMLKEIQKELQCTLSTDVSAWY